MSSSDYTDSSPSSDSSLSSDEKDYQDSNLQLSGKILKKYNFISELGRGSYSIVWLAYNIENSNYYAVKVQNSEDYEDGLSEIQIMKRFDKNIKNINHVIEYFIHKEKNGNKIEKYLCSVFKLHAGNLDVFIRKGKYKDGYPTNSVIIMFKQLINALNYLHSKIKIFHGDIKPDNILIEGINKYDYELIKQYENYNFMKSYSDMKKQYWISLGKNLKNIKKMKKEIKLEIRKKVHREIVSKIINIDTGLKYEIDEKYINNPSISICDFGDFCNDDEQHNDEFGTRYYRAPEIMLDGDCDNKVDIWACACTLFEILTGKILFDPSKDDIRSRNYYHLLDISSVCGEYKKKFLKSTNKYKDYFNKKYMFKFDDKIQKNDIIKKLYEDNNTKELADLLSNILRIDPRKRFDCKQILNHKIFND